MTTAVPSRLLGYLWLCALAAALVASAAAAYDRAMRVHEHAFGCDPFGYLRMAQEVRSAAARGAWPDYHIDPPHTRALIDDLTAAGIPHEAWAEAVAPHAHHYFPASGKVGAQYPPGTGWLLALFPEGRAVHGLNRSVIGAFVVAGLVALVVAGRRRAWASAGAVVFALQLGLQMLGDIGGLSYSINAMLVPLLASFALVFASKWTRAAGRARLALAAALLAGAAFGLAVLVRLPILFLLPGTALLLVGADRRTFVNGPLRAFLAGAAVCGVAPLLHHQHTVAGAWHLSTYGTADNSPPRLDALKANEEYYLGNGPGGRYNWSLRVALIGAMGLTLKHLTETGVAALRRWARVAAAVVVLWGVSAAYFLTHAITIPYYQTPATFAAVLVLALGGLAIDGVSRAAADGRPRRGGVRWLWGFGLLVALVPGVAACDRAWSACPRGAIADPAPPHRSDFPAELTDERAWVLADIHTGMYWYYARRPAYKIPFADGPTRAHIYRVMRSRGGPLYVIRDWATMDGILEELRAAGATVERRGVVDAVPYYRVDWPAP